jgi:hypothetical protein
MKKNIIFIILMALFLVPIIFAKEPFMIKLNKISKNNPDLVTLKNWQETTQKKYDKGGIIQPQFSDWSEISTPTLLKLFPSYRFYTISWNESAAEKSKKEYVACAYGLYVILSVQQETKEIKEYSGYGNYESFGELLRVAKIRITSKEQAKLIWDAFCDLHQKYWKDQAIKQINAKKWHLGIITIDDFNYYYEVNLDDNDIVINGKLYAYKTKN